MNNQQHCESWLFSCFDPNSLCTFSIVRCQLESRVENPEMATFLFWALLIRLNQPFLGGKLSIFLAKQSFFASSIMQFRLFRLACVPSEKVSQSPANAQTRLGFTTIPETIASAVLCI